MAHHRPGAKNAIWLPQCYHCVQAIDVSKKGEETCHEMAISDQTSTFQTFYNTLSLLSSLPLAFYAHQIFWSPNECFLLDAIKLMAFFKSLCQFCSHALLSAVISQDPFTFSFYLWISFEPKIDSLFTELEKWCWLTFKKIISIWDSKMICWRCEVSKWMFLSM